MRLFFADAFMSSMNKRLIMLVGFIFAQVAASGQIFITSESDGTIAEYNLSGALINSDLVSGLGAAKDVATDGNGNLYVCSGGNNVVGEYTIGGATVNSTLFQTVSSGFYSMNGIALDGSGNIFVSQSQGDANVAEYTVGGQKVNDPLIALTSQSPRGLASDGMGNLFVALNTGGGVSEFTTSGQLVQANLIFFQNASSVALDGDGHIFVGGFGGTVGEYNLNGTPVNASLITGLGAISDIAVEGNRLFVVDETQSTIGEYTTSGQAVNASLITGVSDPWGIVVIPEPSPMALFGMSVAIFGLRYWLKRRGVLVFFARLIQRTKSRILH